MTTYIAWALVGLNVSWAVAGAIKDHRKTDKSDVHSRINRNLNISTRNLQCAAINIGIVILLKLYLMLSGA